MIIDILSISQLLQLYGCPPPVHPLISVIDLAAVDRSRLTEGAFYRPGFYTIFWKQVKGAMKYGRSHYDFEEGSIMFTAPHQVIAPEHAPRIPGGGGLFFPPLLL